MVLAGTVVMSMSMVMSVRLLFVLVFVIMGASCPINVFVIIRYDLWLNFSLFDVT